MTCFGQWNTSGSDISLPAKALRVSTCFSTFSLPRSMTGELTMFQVGAGVLAWVPANLGRHIHEHDRHLNWCKSLRFRGRWLLSSTSLIVTVTLSESSHLNSMLPLIKEESGLVCTSDSSFLRKQYTLAQEALVLNLRIALPGFLNRRQRGIQITPALQYSNWEVVIIPFLQNWGEG